MTDDDPKGEATRSRDARRTGDPSRPRTANRRAVLRTAVATGAAVVWGASTVAGVPRRESDPGGSSAGGFPPEGITEHGDAVDLGNGSVRTFTAETPSGEPKYHGVEFDRAALGGVPGTEELEEATEGTYPDKYGPSGEALVVHGRWSLEFFVPFPDAAETPFTFLGLNWNPGGHPGGEGAWEVPHFDIHFHMLETDAVDAITGPAPAPYDGIPGDRIPEGYLRSPPATAEERYITDMGEHLAPEDAPEIPADPDAFTTTLIQGFVGVGADDSDPRLAFLEPMITRAFLRGFEGSETYEIPQPRTFPHDRQHPTVYGLRDVPARDAIAVMLGGFERV
ncbi:MAG: hypothetical protein R6U01_13515 [Halorubrum sp.]|uniref:hypothetical protein n=1 Tax=Halorubrum sp. TaxID=1879286 RepID=UPI00397096A4